MCVRSGSTLPSSGLGESVLSTTTPAVQTGEPPVGLRYVTPSSRYPFETVTTDTGSGGPSRTHGSSPLVLRPLVTSACRQG